MFSMYREYTQTNTHKKFTKKDIILYFLHDLVFFGDFFLNKTRDIYIFGQFSLKYISLLFFFLHECIFKSMYLHARPKICSKFGIYSMRKGKTVEPHEFKKIFSWRLRILKCRENGMEMNAYFKYLVAMKVLLVFINYSGSHFSAFFVKALSYVLTVCLKSIRK